MKRIALLGSVVVMALVQSAQADIIFDNSGSQFAGGTIPDGNLVGRSFSQTLSGLPTGPITDVNVTLDISGNWNGDLYAYLTHGDGFAVLLNRVGRGDSPQGTTTGYSTHGMAVTFDNDLLANNIHWVAAPNGAGYSPDGREILPTDAPSLFSSTAPTALLGSFNGGNANGTWTLYLADVSGGDTSTLNGWSLEIAAVPEPASLIEGSVAVLFLGGIVWVYRRKAAKQQPQAC